MQKIAAIVNPRAGAGRCGRRWPAIARDLRGHGVELEEHFTSRPQEATDIVTAATARGICDVLAVGGDGTAFEVANGLLPGASQATAEATKPRLAVLPLGTGNSLVEHFQRTSADVINSLRSGSTRPLDVLRVHYRTEDQRPSQLVALSTITLGIATLAARTVNRYLKPLRAAAYHVGALLETVRLRNVKVEFTLHNGSEQTEHRRDTPLLALQNTTTFGKGMHIAPGAQTDDGQADLVIVDPVSRLDLLRTLPKVYSGEHLQHPAVHLHRFESIHFIDPQPQLFMIDGEIRTLLVQQVDVLPHGLDLYI